MKRKELHEEYWFIDEHLKVRKEHEGSTLYDGLKWNCGNYFETEEQAGRMRERILNMLKDR